MAPSLQSLLSEEPPSVPACAVISLMWPHSRPLSGVSSVISANVSWQAALHATIWHGSDRAPSRPRGPRRPSLEEPSPPATRRHSRRRALQRPRHPPLVAVATATAARLASSRWIRLCHTHGCLEWKSGKGLEGNCEIRAWEEQLPDTTAFTADKSQNLL